MKKVFSRKLKTHHLVRISIVSLGIFLSTVVIFYWLSGWRTDQVIIERLESQQLDMARSAALSINEFLKAQKKELIVLSELEVIQASREEESMEILEALAHELKEEGAPVGNIIRVDKEGITLWGINVPLGKQDETAIGVDLSDRDCFLWAKEKAERDEVRLNEPIMAQGGYLKGKRVVAMLVPVYYQGLFDGIIVTTFPIDELAEKYIGPISRSPQTYFTIVSGEGVVITSTFEELIGKNILQVQEEENWPEASRQLIRIAIRGEEGASFHSYVNLLTGEPSEAVSAYTPIKVDGSIWSLWVSVPYERIKELVLPFRQNQVFALVIASGGVLVLAIIFVLGIRVSQRDSFLDGYSRAKDEHNRKKKS